MIVFSSFTLFFSVLLKAKSFFLNWLARLPLQSAHGLIHGDNFVTITTHWSSEGVFSCAGICRV